MAGIFLKIVNMSISACWIVLASFVGYIEIPVDDENYIANTRQGVAVEYIPQSA